MFKISVRHPDLCYARKLKKWLGMQVFIEWISYLPFPQQIGAFHQSILLCISIPWRVNLLSCSLLLIHIPIKLYWINTSVLCRSTLVWVCTSLYIGGLMKVKSMSAFLGGCSSSSTLSLPSIILIIVVIWVVLVLVVPININQTLMQDSFIHPDLPQFPFSPLTLAVKSSPWG